MQFNNFVNNYIASFEIWLHFTCLFSKRICRWVKVTETYVCKCFIYMYFTFISKFNYKMCLIHQCNLTDFSEKVTCGRTVIQSSSVVSCRNESWPQQFLWREVEVQGISAGLRFDPLVRQQPQPHELLPQERGDRRGSRQRWVPWGAGEGTVRVKGSFWASDGLVIWLIRAL